VIGVDALSQEKKADAVIPKCSEQPEEVFDRLAGYVARRCQGDLVNPTETGEHGLPARIPVLPSVGPIVIGKGGNHDAIKSLDLLPKVLLKFPRNSCGAGVDSEAALHGQKELQIFDLST
jgi:hypothetical protein